MGCCGGSSGNPSSSTYRGPSAFSTPETRAVRDVVASRVVGGTQQLRTAIDFHTYSELVLSPYGHTYTNTATGMNADEVIAREPSRNRAAVLSLPGLSDCPCRAIGQQARYCA